MFNNYFKIALRNIKRYKVYSVINILGLAIGIAACLVIFLFVTDELSYDKFHENGDRLFRVMKIDYDNATGEEENRSQFLPPAMGPELERAYQEIKFMSRQIWGVGAVRYQDKIFRETIQFVDAPFFQMFSFPLISGNPETALTDDNSLVLTRSIARKYFGTENPTGKMITINYGNASKDYTVTGVAEDVPRNSTIQFDILVHIKNLAIATNNPELLNDWNRWYFPFYIQLAENIAPKQFEPQLHQFCLKYFEAKIQELRSLGWWTRDGLPFSFGLQPISEMYIDSRGLMPSVILSAIAIMILIIASVNFTNISIGLSSVRYREVGMRKVLGADRRHIMRQFWGEAILMSLLAMGFSLLITELLLPFFNSLWDKNLSLLRLFSGGNTLIIPIIVIIAGLLAGSYPALVMSRPGPIEVLKNRLRLGGKTPMTRGLVVLQFVLSTVLIISAMILGQQATYLLHKDLRYEQQGLIVVLTQENDQQRSEVLYERFRNKAISHNQIKGITACNREFGLFLPGTTLKLNDQKIFYRFNRIDPYFISTLGLSLTQGRDFSPNLSTDEDAVIVNQKFIQALGTNFKPGNPLGSIYDGFPYNSRIIGVIEDFHFQSLLSEIEPVLLYIGKGLSEERDLFSRMIVRFDAGSMREVMEFLESTWKEIQPDKPFISYFQDDALKSLYTREKQWSTIIQFASLLSIIIACMGILGLTAVTLSRRIKEIGIRKVLGASVPQITFLTIKEFLVLVGCANIISWPIVYLVMRNVLQSYPYRIGIGWHNFFISGISMVFIAVVTISYLSLKAALANPVESLRYE